MDGMRYKGLYMQKDIDLKNWRYFLNEDKITTNARWLSTPEPPTHNKPIFGNFYIPKRDFLPKPDNEHHGIWIAEIPYQMIKRFTKSGDKIWSQFGGSGVDYEVSKLLDRTCYINDLNPKKDYIIEADSRFYKTPEKVDLILSHPPYWDMVKYSEKEEDGSSKTTLKEFLIWWNEILVNSIKNLKDKGFFVFACGNMYKNSEEIELGQLLLILALNNGFILKQHIIKDYGETKGSESKNYNINYYRQLKGKYGNFYGDNIFILQKRKSKNNIINALNSIIRNNDLF